MVGSTSIPHSFLSLLPMVSIQRLTGPLSFHLGAAADTAFADPNAKDSSEWHTKLCLRHSRATLACIPKVVFIPTTNQFQRPASWPGSSLQLFTPLYFYLSYFSYLCDQTKSSERQEGLILAHSVRVLYIMVEVGVKCWVTVMDLIVFIFGSRDRCWY